MKYQELVDVYSALENTTKRLEKTIKDGLEYGD